jgi:hypothetical protein
VKAAEDALLEGAHASAESLKALLPKMESWSRILIEAPESGLGLSNE